MQNVINYLKFQKFWNVESNGKHNHTNDVVNRMASSDMDP